MYKNPKLHFRFLIVIALITAIFSSQAISTHTHLVEEHKHSGIHLHETETHSHNWTNHFSNTDSHQHTLSNTVDIEQACNLLSSNVKTLDKIAILSRTHQVTFKQSIQVEQSNTQEPIRFKPFQSSINPRAPPFFS